MTPKEKAIELVHKFCSTTEGFYKSKKNIKNAKKCAIIAVDEILAIFYDDYQSMWISELNFWHCVKNEIQAL